MQAELRELVHTLHESVRAEFASELEQVRAELHELRASIATTRARRTPSPPREPTTIFTSAGALSTKSDDAALPVELREPQLETESPAWKRSPTGDTPQGVSVQVEQLSGASEDGKRDRRRTRRLRGGEAMRVVAHANKVSRHLSRKTLQATGLSRLAVAAVEEPPEQMELKESIWDASVLIGTDQVGKAASVYIVVLLVMNLFVQGAFAFILATSKQMVSESYTRDEIDGLLDWRRKVAHDVRYFNGEASLVARVCDGAEDLELSGQQASAYEDLSGYLADFTQEDGSRGSLGLVMSCIALLTWYLTLCSEAISTVTFFRATLALPRGPTRISSTEEAYTFERISKSRLMGSLSVAIIRAVLIVILFMYGTLFLAYTISLNDLVLNTVALEFIINVDEVIFAALSPAQVRRVLSSTAPLKLPARKQWSGMDMQAISLLTFVVGVLSLVVGVTLMPQYERLSDAADAICGGDRAFVSTTDGLGTVSWGYPRDRGENVTRPWIFGGNMSGRPLDDIVIDGALEGHGSDSEDCGLAKCHDFTDGEWTGFKPFLEQHPCCMVQTARAISVEAGGGKFSVISKSTESLADGTLTWNTGCQDVLDVASADGGFLAASVSAMINSHYDDSEPCGGPCHDPSTACDVSTGTCVSASCDLMMPFCHEQSVLGTRARQLCPRKCGCADPHSPLVLYLEKDGCSPLCFRTTWYQHSLASLPCEDAAFGDPALDAYLDAWELASLDWPSAEQILSGSYIAFLRWYGCDYISNATIYPLWPMGLGGFNLCVEGGMPSPIKPLSYFCPVACGCHAGDNHCPSTCPVRNTSHARASAGPAHRLDPRIDEYFDELAAVGFPI